MKAAPVKAAPMCWLNRSKDGRFTRQRRFWRDAWILGGVKKQGFNNAGIR